MPSAIVTGSPVPCSYSACPHGGEIQVGDLKIWGPRLGGGIFFHAACVEPAAKERESIKEDAPAPVKPTPVIPNGNDPASLIMAAMQSIAQSTTPTLDRDAVEAIVREALERQKDSFGVRRVEVVHKDRPAVDCGVQHRLFPRLVDLIANGESVYVWGPAGTGKTQAAIEAAKGLGLDYAVISLNPQSPASKIEGFITAQGEFTNPDFYRLYTQGGVFIVDEFDNMSASIATSFNSALANGVASFPNGQAKRHKEFIFIATGNTDGRGPTRLYPERRKLDSASIDRLHFLHWTPDTQLETALAIAHGNGKDSQVKAWAKWVQFVRDYMERSDCGITDSVYCGMRAIIGGSRSIAAGYDWITIEELAQSTVFKGLSSDKVSRIIAVVPYPQGVL